MLVALPYDFSLIFPPYFKFMEAALKHILTTILIILFFLPLIHADTINIPEDLPTIQAGIDSASAGDTVLVADGTYFENITFNGKAITVASHYIITGDTLHIGNTIIDGSQPAHPDTASVVYFTSGEDTTSILSGFTITGGKGTLLEDVIEFASKGGGGILIIDAGARISYNRIRQNHLDNVDLAVGAGIFAIDELNTSEIIIERNAISDNSISAGNLGAIGGGLAVSTRGRIIDNKIIENSLFAVGGSDVNGGSFGSGIIVADLTESFSLSGQILISGNLISKNASRAAASTRGSTGAVHIEVEEAIVKENAIEDNIVLDTTIGLGAGLTVAIANENSLVQGNKITGNRSTGVDGLGGGMLLLIVDELAVSGNWIENNESTSGGGLAIFESRVLLHKNIIAKNTASLGGGIWLQATQTGIVNEGESSLQEDVLAAISQQRTFLNFRHSASTHKSSSETISTSNSAQFVNNTIAENQASISGGGLFGISSSATVINSIFWGNDAPENSQVQGSAYITYSTVEGGAGGTGNIDLDPEFEITDDYLLQASSPAIDAGNPDSQYEDMEDPNNPGSPLSPAQGTLRNDMGAHGGNPDSKISSTIQGPQFRAFVERVEAAPANERGAIIDSFMTAAESFPFIEENTLAYYVYRGSGNFINVPGDANGWDGNAFPMTRLAGTTFWYREAVFEPDARLDYKFAVNGSNWILDPLNPRRVSGGFGPNSELAMPEYVDPPEIEFDPNIPHGTLEDTVFFSTALNNSRLVRIYLPPSYEAAGSDSFPIMLFHDGLEYLSLGSAKNVLDNLIAANRIKPVIGIFVPPIDRSNEYAFDKTVQFETFIVDELMPAIDDRWRTSSNPHERAMIGASFGGLISTQICYNRPESFGLPAPVSPAYWPKNMEIFNTVVNGPVKDLKFYVDWGTYEVSIMFSGRAFRDAMLDKGYAMDWREWHEGHSWGSWRAHLDLALEYFFPGPAVGIGEEIISAVPETFQLKQNFPNPFNPTTNIEFQVANNEFVELKIYDVSGRLVKTLITENRNAGAYSISWDATNDAGIRVASGMYFYRLQAGSLVQTRKMVLMQ